MRKIVYFYKEDATGNVCADKQMVIEVDEAKYNDDYISWSPKEEFEESYREIKTLNDIKIKELIKTNWEDFPAHQQRVITEVTELDIKIEKLDNFILTSYIFKSLEKDEQLLFINQIQSMQYYFGILVERINKFK